MYLFFYNKRFANYLQCKNTDASRNHFFWPTPSIHKQVSAIYVGMDAFYIAKNTFVNNHDKIRKIFFTALY